MKKKLFGLLIFALLLVGCSTAASPAEDAPVEPLLSPTNTPVPAPEIPEIFVSARNDLARTNNIPATSISIAASEEKMFRDGCLELGGPAESCLAAITPGYRVVFDTPEGQFVYHVEAEGAFFRAANGYSTAQPLEDFAKVMWFVSGGIAGICEQFEILPLGLYTLTDCASGDVISKGLLPKSSFDEIYDLVARYEYAEWESTLPDGAADMFSYSFVFLGEGNESMPEDVKEALNEKLFEIYTIVKKG